MNRHYTEQINVHRAMQHVSDVSKGIMEHDSSHSPSDPSII